MKVVIATGGSGGHLFPSVQLARNLVQEGHNVFFLGSFGQNTLKLKKENFCFQELGAHGLNLRSVTNFFSTSGSILQGSIKAYKCLKNNRPNVVVGFGGYGAFPAVFSAFFLKIPTLIHEQNFIPGRANKVLSRWASKVAVSFKETEKYFQKKKTILTGCPIHITRPSISRQQILRGFRLEEGRKTILVFGGSQGSRAINTGFLEAAQRLKKNLAFQVIHICGQTDYNNLKKVYEQLEIPVALFSFLEDIGQAYTVSDLVVSRSGAATVTEIDMFQLPAVLIPYPYAGGHQRHNAGLLARQAGIKIIEEKDLTAESLSIIIEEILSKSSIHAQSCGIYIPDASKRLIREIQNLVHET